MTSSLVPMPLARGARGAVVAPHHLATSAGRGFADVYRPKERPWRPGEVVRLPRLAATLERLVDDGFEAFYDGDLAARQCVALAAAGFEIKEADFAAHRSTWAEPIETTY